MSKATKPIDIPLRASKKSLVEIGQNLLSDEGGSVELVVGKPTRYSKSAKEEIETDKIDILSPSLESNSFMSGSDLQSLSLAEELSVAKKLEFENVSVLLSPLSASNKENIDSVPAVSVTAPESVKETPSISLHAIPEPIPSSLKSIRPMASESLTDDTFLSVGSSDKDSGIGTTLQSDLEVNKKSLEQGFIQEEQEITTLGDGYFIFQLDE
ncbi:MAG: hypothetical protein FJX70_00420 [Alphaproteobacteria bacterium]|nr:hypothetical protein [Alphaproteobacteria bacterium]